VAESHCCRHTSRNNTFDAVVRRGNGRRVDPQGVQSRLIKTARLSQSKRDLGFES